MPSYGIQTDNVHRSPTSPPAGGGSQTDERLRRNGVRGSVPNRRLVLGCGMWALLALAACSPDDSGDATPVPRPGPGAPNEPGPEKPSSETPSTEMPVVRPEPPSVEPPAMAGPALRDRVDLADLELGRQVLTLLAGDGAGAEGHCSGCHSVTRPTLSFWRSLTRAFSSACLGQSALDRQEQVDAIYECLVTYSQTAKGITEFDPALGDTLLSPRTVGIYAAASHLPWFSSLLENASALAGGNDAHGRFVQRVGMPRGAGKRLTQAEFNLVAEWFERDLPGMLELVPVDPGEPCVAGLAPELAAELDELELSGWRAKNRETPLLMFGCGPGKAGRECLSELPNAGDTPASARWADAVPGSIIRLLYDNSPNPQTLFWTRSSADGRYVASGTGGDGDDPSVEAALGLSGQFIDLAGPRRILGSFSYDPTFFPDNSGFLVQGSIALDENGKVDPSSGTLVCNQTVLDGRFETITHERQGCTGLGTEIGLYQQLATSLDGGDDWAVHGLFESDEPGSGEKLVERNPYAPFDADSKLGFTPIINRGDGFEHQGTVSVATPFQGDPVLSPSGRLLVTRTKGAELFSKDPLGDYITSVQSGYSLYRVETARGANAWSVSLERAGQICMEGGKGTFSYDERWLALHHYITAADATELGFESARDPGFADYAARGGANLYLVDLRSGQATRITNMAPGQYALFPQFRSDGWVYFVVRSSDGSERFFATDAALELEGGDARR
jgi:hypothetical protein